MGYMNNDKRIPEERSQYELKIAKLGTKMTKKNNKTKYKKAPQAPRRFKSAYMFFSTTKHKDIREELGAQGQVEKTTDIAKMVSQAWKDLTAEEREEWEEMARQDKARYEVEKSLYTGPWKVPAKKRSQKDPNAPKRPMSAFLAYSHAKRAEVKQKSPGMNNAEISRVLAQMWKDAPEEEKKDHIDKEYQLRQKYLSEIAVWRENTEKEFNDQRKHREDVAMKTVAARSNAASLHDNGLDTSEENPGTYDKDGEAMDKGDGAGPYAGYHAPRHHYYAAAGEDQGQYNQYYRPPYLPPPEYPSSQQASHAGGEASQDGYDGYAPGYGYYAPPAGAAQYASGGHEYPPSDAVYSSGYPPSDYTNSGAGYRQPALSAYGAYYDQQAYPAPHGDQGYDREQYPYEVPHHHAYASMYREGTPTDYSKPGSAGNEPTSRGTPGRRR